jgi:hypothetical protein
MSENAGPAPGAQAIAEYSPTEAGLAELRQRLSGVVFNCATTAGDREARAARQELVKLRTALEARRVELKRPALDYVARIDSEAKRITAEIRALETPIDTAIRAEEQRKADEKAAREREEKRIGDALQHFRTFVDRAQGTGTERIKQLMEQTADHMGQTDFGPKRPEAQLAYDQTIGVLRVLLATATAREEAERRREEQAAAERERAAALARQLEAERAARAQEQAEARARELEAERRAQAAEAEVRRLKEEAARRSGGGGGTVLGGEMSRTAGGDDALPLGTLMMLAEAEATARRPGGGGVLPEGTLPRSAGDGGVVAAFVPEEPLGRPVLVPGFAVVPEGHEGVWAEPEKMPAESVIPDPAPVIEGWWPGVGDLLECVAAAYGTDHATATEWIKRAAAEL